MNRGAYTSDDLDFAQQQRSDDIIAARGAKLEARGSALPSRRIGVNHEIQGPCRLARAQNCREWRGDPETGESVRTSPCVTSRFIVRGLRHSLSYWECVGCGDVGGAHARTPERTHADNLFLVAEKTTCDKMSPTPSLLT